MFSTSNALKNGMSWPISTNNHGGDRLQGKGLDTGQVLPSGDWALVLPTHKLVATSLQSYEIFVKIGSSVHKLFTIFHNTDTQMNHLFTICRYGRNFLPCFLLFHLHSDLALLVNSVSFGWRSCFNNYIYKQFTWRRLALNIFGWLMMMMKNIYFWHVSRSYLQDWPIRLFAKRCSKKIEINGTGFSNLICSNGRFQWIK